MSKIVNYDPQLIYLIDWCLTPTLAVFRVYCGMSLFLE